MRELFRLHFRCSVDYRLNWSRRWRGYEGSEGLEVREREGAGEGGGYVVDVLGFFVGGDSAEGKRALLELCKRYLNGNFCLQKAGSPRTRNLVRTIKFLLNPPNTEIPRVRLPSPVIEFVLAARTARC